jgi:hypothetical protein
MYNLNFPTVDEHTYADAFEKVSKELHGARTLYGNTLAIASDSPTVSNIDAATKAALDVAIATSNFLKVRANMLELREAEAGDVSTKEVKRTIRIEI